MHAMTAHLFVFGTLKQGFGNFHVNRGRRVSGDFVTVEPHPLFIVGPRHLPWLLERPGQGLAVTGQLFEVDDAALAAMDRLERVDEPDWYERRCIAVRPSGDAAAEPVQAFVYFGSGGGMVGKLVHAGPLAEYTPALAQQFPVNVA
jgi:gamma-glutamylaminecyclotransferase